MVTKRDYSLLVGKKFGRWTVLETFREGVYVKAKCLCECGNIGQSVRVNTLERGESRSCGCLQKEECSSRTKTHGYSKHPMYQAHYDMLRRCYDSKRKDYQHYGGRGITVCDRWRESGGKGFENFLQDSKNFIGDGNEIDRINVDGNYEPTNCKWATRKEQTRNTRFNHVIDYNGESKCLAEWSESLRIPYHMLQDRLGKLGWSVDKAFTYKMRPKYIYAFHGENRFELKDIFKAPPNHFYRAKRLGIPAYQYLANLLRGLFEVKVLIAGDLHSIEPIGIEIDKVNLNLADTFIKYCEDHQISL